MLTRELKNTITELSLFQKTFNFKGVVFTGSKPVMKYANDCSVTTLPIPKRNKFKMPIFKEMMLTLRSTYNATYYGYMNSDILMHPHIFELLDEVSQMQKHRMLHHYVQLGARVRAVDSAFAPKDFSNIETCMTTFGLPRPGYWRSNMTAVWCCA